MDLASKKTKASIVEVYRICEKDGPLDLGLEPSLYLDQINIRLQQILKRTQAMNVITFFPNYYANQIVQPSLAYSPLNLKLPPIITLISQALQTSIISYEKELFSQTQTQICDKKEQLTTPAVKQADEQRWQTVKEVKQKTIKVFKSERENNQLKEVIIAENPQKVGRESSQLITNESEPQEAVQNKEAKKTRILSRAIKKDKTKPKKSLAKIKLSLLNLIQFATPSTLGIKAEELSTKKQSLLQRQVKFWDDKFKDRRDKREIRMLNF